MKTTIEGYIENAELEDGELRGEVVVPVKSEKALTDVFGEKLETLFEGSDFSWDITIE